MKRVVVAAGVLVPVVLACEVLLAWWLVGLVGWGWTLLGMVATTVLGGWLLRREGVSGWRRLWVEVGAGRAPGRVVVTGILGAVGSVLIILPGFVTDLLGCLVVGPLRPWLVDWVTRRWVGSGGFGPRRVRGGRGAPTVEGGPVVEGEVVE